MRLINLVPPNPYESLESHLAQLGQANHYTEKNWFYALIELPRETHVNFLYSEIYFERLSELVNLSVYTLRSMTLHRFVRNFYSPEAFLQLPTGQAEDHEGLRWEERGLSVFIGGTGDKICPRCFEQNGTFLLPWVLRPITTCPTHQVLLLDICNACGQRLKLNNSVCATCGQPVTQMKSIPINNDPMSTKLTELVWSAIECSEATFPCGEGYPFTEFTPPLFFQLLWKLGSLLLEYDRANPHLQVIDLQRTTRDGRRIRLRELDVYSYHQVMTAVVELFMNWPSNWYYTLQQILQSEMTRRAAMHSDPKSVWKRRSFPYTLYKALGNVSAWKWVWRSLVEFIESCDAGLAGSQYWRPYLELNWDEKSDDVQNSQLGSRKNRGIQSVSSVNKPADVKGRAAPDSVMVSNAGNYELLSVTQAADYLGISRGAVIELTKFGLIPIEPRALPHSRLKWCFRPDHLDTAINELFGNLPVLSPPPEAENRIVLLTGAVNQVNHAGVKWIDLIKAIRQGDLLAYRVPATVGLKAIWLYEEALSLFLERWLFLDGVVLQSIYKVEKILKCSKKTLGHLAKTGLLVPVQGFPNENQKEWYYNRQDVEMFQERYVTSDVAASIIGCRPRSVMDWVKQGKLEAVSGPGIDDAPHYRFDKQKVIQWREERLTSVEARALLGIKPRTMEDWIAKGKLKPLENMGRQPYWFAREDINRIKENRKGL